MPLLEALRRSNYRPMNAVALPELFPFDQYWWLYAVFLALVALILALDLGVFHREAHAVKFKEAAAWSLVWVCLALIFNYAFYQFALYALPLDPRLAAIPGLDTAALAHTAALEFLTGYVIEKALSADNIFVFVVVFAYFGVPLRYQHRVLFFGILGAVLLRGIFVALGASVIQYKWVEILFGFFLLLTGVKIFFTKDTTLNPAENRLIQYFKNRLPVTDQFDGQKLFLIENGRRLATPLFLALIFIEFSDVVFAIDSVPAIFAITREPFIVFTSNIFAILGLRSLYFLLAGVVGKFHLLKFGLGAVLVFVGLKMIWLDHAFGGKFPVTWSLGFIVIAVGGSIGLSLLRPQPEN